MYFPVVCTNLLYWYQMGGLFTLLIPLLWAGSIGAEVYLQVRFQDRKHRRRSLTYLTLCMSLVCEAALWTLGDRALPFYLSYHFAAAAFVGSLLGKVGYAVMEYRSGK